MHVIDAPAAAPDKTAHVTPEPAGTPPPARRHAVREEIQALRALAVLLVVVYHYWPSVAPAGFVGVDVFFVISGFLITDMLLREVDMRGTVSLPRFWARRARRLLPAALLTVAAVAAATIAFVPVTDWQQFFGEMRASTLYVQNWHLANAAVDYFAPHDLSPMRHFWSLSAEEQFYLAWPLLLLAGVGLARLWRGRLTRATIFAVLAVTTAASLAYSILETAADPLIAYFSTPARAWEFGAGGLLAFAAAPGARLPRARAALSWVGLAAILTAALAHTAPTDFPGWVALLPVAGALAVMHAGMPRVAWAPAGALRQRPVQFLGDVSYSVYLWHWPLLVLAPFVLGTTVGSAGLGVLLALTVALAWATKLVVEDPVRAARALTLRPARWTLIPAGLVTAAVVGVTAGGSAHVDAQIAHDAAATKRTLAGPPRCFGAAVRDPRTPCVNPRLSMMVVPTPLEVRSMANTPCRMIVRDRRLRVCAFGAPAATATQTVALIGDSHASALRPAVEHVAKARRWRALSITRTRCTFTAATMDIPSPMRGECRDWSRQVLAWLHAHPSVTTVLLTQHAGAKVKVGDAPDMLVARERGYLRAWRQLPASVRRVVVVHDTPNMEDRTLTCVQQAIGRSAPGAQCAVPRRRAVPKDAAARIVPLLPARRFKAVDLTDFICGSRACLPVIGGALVFRDEDHLSPTFAKTLGPYLDRAIPKDPAGAGPQEG